jgi:DNA-binding GntR family transcriptional regulator
MGGATSPRKGKRAADLAEQAFGRLVQAILAGELENGMPLREAALARTWNVSRTPLREAVRRAAAAGLLILRPNQAPLVRPLGVADVQSLYDVRELLEIHALELAWPSLTSPACDKLLAMAQRAAPGQRNWRERCLRFDLALHRSWSESCGNAWLRADLERYYQFLQIFQRWIGRDPEALKKGYHDHIAILQAIRDRRRATACESLRKHIRESAEFVEAAIVARDSDPERDEDTRKA